MKQTTLRRRIKPATGSKGNVILDTIFIAIILFAFGLISIIGYKLSDKINTDLQASSNVANISKDTYQELHTRYPSLFDGLFLTLLILLWIASLVASFMVNTHPIFLIVTIFLMAFMLFLGMILSNTFEEVANSDDLSTSSNSFPITTFIMSHLYLVLLVIGGSIAVVLFAKYKQ